MKDYIYRILLVILLMGCMSSFVDKLQAQPKMRRICASAAGVNTVFWYAYPDTCQGVEKIIIWGRKDKSSPYQKIDSVAHGSELTYEHSNAASYQRGSYFLQYILNCNGTKKINSDTLDVDVYAPGIIDPDSISVGEKGEIYIGWEPGSSPDTKSYVVYRMVNSNNFPVDTTIGQKSTFFLDSTHGHATTGPERYRLATMDSCDNIAPIGAYHQTIFLSVSQDSCAGTISLGWTGYEGWKAGIERYNVYMSEGSGKPWTLIGNTTGNSYLFSGGKTNIDYHFFVRAIRKDKPKITSSSNRVHTLTNFGTPLDFIYIHRVTVQDQHILLEWAISLNKGVSSFQIFRGTTNPFALKYYTTVSATGTDLYSYTDVNTDVDNSVYFYQVVAYNKCGRIIGRSNVSHSILLNLAKNEFGIRQDWNAYGEWNGKVQEYDLFRSTNAESNDWQPIAQLDGHSYTYLDTDTFGEYSKEGICYRIVAVEDNTDTLGFKDTSYSNKVCHIDPPLVWMPNAFTPLEASNQIFKPITLHIDTTVSTMVIYNRWGQRIYETNNISAGWNGHMSDGTAAPAGVYLYMVQAIGYDHSIHNLKGSFSLL